MYHESVLATLIDSPLIPPPRHHWEHASHVTTLLFTDKGKSAMHAHWTGVGHEECGSHFCLLDNKIKAGGFPVHASTDAKEGEGRRDDCA